MNIEHGIIRALFDEPRIHFALNCASVSCPRLQNRAYSAEELGEQLTRAAREFLSDESKNKFSEDRQQISRIFSCSDFRLRTSGLYPTPAPLPGGPAPTWPFGAGQCGILPG
ncbi:MAG: DUF547 domain-containing protein [Phaeodactylibacter sp.]|nr:DUF547 domain-containing protein [Phaeodactylibacter sp.]